VVGKGQSSPFGTPLTEGRGKGAHLVVVLEVAEGVRLVLGVGELLGEGGEALELGELPLLGHERVLRATAMIGIHQVEEDSAVERLAVGADVLEDLVERRRVRALADGKAAARVGGRRSAERSTPTSCCREGGLVEKEGEGRGERREGGRERRKERGGGGGGGARLG